MADKFLTGKRNPVYFRVGSFDDGEPKFVKAPFDLLMWSESGQKDEMLVTCGMGGPTSYDGFVDATDVEWEAQHYLNEFGFLGEPIYVEEHSMGVGDGIFGVNAISLL